MSAKQTTRMRGHPGQPVHEGTADSGRSHSEIGNMFDQTGSDKNTVHSYAEVYERHLTPLQGKNLSLLEIGVRGGESLAVWKSFLGPGLVATGIDIDASQCRKDLVGDTRVIECHQADFPKLHRAIAGSVFDLVIDDGSHLCGDYLTTLVSVWPNLVPGGLYFIEDLLGWGQSAWDTGFLDGLQVLPVIELHRGFKNGRRDDCLLVLRKPL